MTSQTATAQAQNVRILPLASLPVNPGLNAATVPLVLVLIIIGAAG